MSLPADSYRGRRRNIYRALSPSAKRLIDWPRFNASLRAAARKAARARPAPAAQLGAAP